jgi:hypothetical protein
MAKGAARSAKPTKAPSMRPVLIAAGLGLFWFVEFQDAARALDAPVWGAIAVWGIRLLADFVGAWFVVSGLQLVVSLARLGLGYLRGLWVGGRA